MQDFWNRVNKKGPWHPRLKSRCWVWTEGLHSHGYGRASIEGVRTRVHRIAFYLTHGHWPEPCCLHRCDNRACVRPSHLYEGTYLDNNRDTHRRHRIDRKGEAGANKLTNKAVLYIRRVYVPYARDWRGCVALAKRFNVTKWCINGVVSRDNWRHL